MKFEFDTDNLVWRAGGKKREKLPRKFGPRKLLHKGKRGRPARRGREGEAIEMQSETGGRVEFETATWFRSWCRLKESIQEAVDMVKAIMTGTLVKTVGGVETREFPFNIGHLARTKRFPRGLTKGETLQVEIVDPDWIADIQSSEDIALTQYESLLKEHERPGRVTSTITGAQDILNAANTKKLPDARVARLLSFLQILVNYINRGQTVDVSTDVAKATFRLMSRTNVSQAYRLLSRDERTLFREIVKTEGILKQLGLSTTSEFFKSGFKGQKEVVTVDGWLKGIVAGKDLLAQPKGGSQAMGRFDVEKRRGRKDTGLVKFEVRGSEARSRSQPVTKWVEYAEEVFKAAATNRPRTGSTALNYNPEDCP